MKKLVCIAVIALATVQQSNARQGSFLGKVSLEAAYGYNGVLDQIMQKQPMLVVLIPYSWV